MSPATLDDRSPAVIYVVSTLAAAALYLPPQTIELYRHFTTRYALEDSYTATLHYNITFLSIAGISLLLFLYCQYLRERITTTSSKLHNYLIAVFCCCLPVFAGAAGVLKARLSSEDLELLRIAFQSYYVRTGEPDPQIYANRLTEAVGSATYLVNAIVGALAVTAVAIFGSAIWIYRSKIQVFGGQRRSRLGAGLAILIGVSVCILVYLNLLDPVFYAQKITFFGVLATFVGAVLFVHFFFLKVPRRYRRVVVASVLIWIAASSTYLNYGQYPLRLSNNGQGDPKNSSDLPSLGDSFIEWLKTRPNSNEYSEYPVFVVSAEGGGLYAAYHTASRLAALQTRCARFGQQVFAVSGVSGGSIGASYYIAAARSIERYHRNDGNLAELSKCEGVFRQGDETLSIVRDIFQWRDFWSPLASALLFRDLAQRVVPFIKFEDFDRSRAIERALEKAWSDILGNEEGEDVLRLTSPFMAHWRPDMWRQRPEPYATALVFNTTEVETGERRAIAPFRFDGDGLAFLSPNETSRVRISTAAVLSARFPWVLPSSYIVDSNGKRKHLVDGGYFENSGIATALDLIRAMNSAYQSRRAEVPNIKGLKIHLIALTSTPFSADRFYGLSTLTDPVWTMLKAREARGRLELAKAKRYFESQTGGPDAGTLIELRLDVYRQRPGEPNGVRRPGSYDLPLAFTLGEPSLMLIDYGSVCENDKSAGSRCADDLVIELVRRTAAHPSK